MTIRTLIAIWMVSVMSLFCLITGCGSDTQTHYHEAPDTTGDEELSLDPPPNADGSYICSVDQAFNFQISGQETVGHVNYLDIGGNVIRSDTSLKNPETPNGDRRTVVGPIVNIYWGGGFAEPINISFRVSMVNKDALVLLLHRELSNTGVEFDFVVFNYDPVSRTYFRAFHSNRARLKGLILKYGDQFALGVNQDQYSDFPSPKNFEAHISIMPQDVSQDIHLAITPSDKFVKKWGVQQLEHNGQDQ